MSSEPLNQINSKFSQLVATIARLRDKEKGCPWDLKQTFSSLRRYMLEEAYEASAVMGSPNMQRDSAALADELGDVLLQVVLNAQIAQDQGLFDIGDVIESIHSKMIRRHPHIFGELQGQSLTSDQVKENWAKIKLTEKADRSNSKKSLFASCRETSFPATTLGFRIGKMAADIGFDWSSIDQVFAHFESEVKELRDAIEQNDAEGQLDEAGDVYFTLAQVVRHLKQEPEVLAHQGNQKFLGRFSVIEEMLEKDGVAFEGLSKQQKEAYWQRAKESEL